MSRVGFFITRFSRDHSSSSLEASPSPLAGSSLTRFTCVHSNAKLRARRLRMKGDSSTACVYATAAGRVGRSRRPRPVWRWMPASRRQYVGKRVRRATCPIAIEILRHVVDDRPDRQNVEIDEQHILARGEILVADIASADHRRLVVGGERLVVHAPVEAGEVEEVSERAPPPHHEWIEEAHLDVGLRVECGERFVEAAGVVVVEEQPHPDTAVGGSAQRIAASARLSSIAPTATATGVLVSPRT